MKINFIEPSISEMHEAFNYYERLEKNLGKKFIQDIRQCLNLIRVNPLAWRNFYKNTRRCLLKKFPYEIIYIVDGDFLLILAVAHLHRKPKYWKGRIPYD